ncbi:MAG: DUF6025 family protein [Minicystis sp.]
MHRDPLQVIEALGLSSSVDVEGLASRRTAFDSVHMGMEDLPIGALLDVIRSGAAPEAPRTGHIGNWEDIALGRAGAMDFNKAICARGLGYPLVYCFTQTEAEESALGDWVYLPGSLAERGRRIALPLFTWDGVSFARRERTRALFCPLVQAEVDGALSPLVELHWRRMQRIPRFQFKLEAAVIAEHADEVRAMLALLLEEASASENPRSMFQDLISHAAARDGAVARCEIRREGAGYWVDDFHYPSTEALVEAVLIPFRAVTDPRRFFAEIASLPPFFPVLSNVVSRIFVALFTADGAGASRGLNLHLHWGARDMAGFPPRQKGYFISRSKTRSLRILCEALVKHFPDFDPLCFVLLPAAIFMLCPTSAHPGDAALLSELFRQIREEVPAFDARRPLIALERAEEVTRSFRARREGALSPYFLNRFRARIGVLHAGDLPAESEPVEPEGFRELTLRQACMILGALVDPSPSGGPA